jgi:initiation factor 1A
MPNLLGGGKYKRTKSKRKLDRNREQAIDPTNGIHFYGLIDKNLGGTCPRFIVKLHDGTTMQSLLPGRMKKKIWLNAGDYVLVYKQGTSCEIMCKINNEYQKKEAEKFLHTFIDDFKTSTVIFGDKRNDMGIMVVNSDSDSDSENKLQIVNIDKIEEKIVDDSHSSCSCSCTCSCKSDNECINMDIL